ncbi:MAG: type 4a pilus biogenesis protein PilO, partial [Candidatus Omnitrophica bacterium]|nr:type 4a pilus biogenesis protein PilO [Candidatus Omnitrophota bacterium]
IKNADQKNIYYGFAGVLVVVFLLDYFIIMRPQLATMNKLTPQINELEGNIERTETNLLRMGEYRKQIKDFETKIAELEFQLTTRSGIPLVLEKISRIANENNVKINQIMPRSNEQEVLLEKDDRVYYDLPIQIEARSQYHDFGRFLNQIESDPAFFKANAFIISQLQGSTDNTIKLILSTIVYEKEAKKSDEKK